MAEGYAALKHPVGWQKALTRGGQTPATHPPAAATRVVVSVRFGLGLIASPAAHAGCAAAVARVTPLLNVQSILGLGWYG